MQSVTAGRAVYMATSLATAFDPDHGVFRWIRRCADSPWGDCSIKKFIETRVAGSERAKRFSALETNLSRCHGVGTRVRLDQLSILLCRNDNVTPERIWLPSE